MVYGLWSALFVKGLVITKTRIVTIFVPQRFAQFGIGLAHGRFAQLACNHVVVAAARDILRWRERLGWSLAARHWRRLRSNLRTDSAAVEYLWPSGRTTSGSRLFAGLGSRATGIGFRLRALALT